MLGFSSPLPFSLDPLIAEAKRRARQRRVFLAFGVTLLVGLAVGLTIAFRSPGGGSSGGVPSGGPASADYSQWGVSFRYPSGWTRLQCNSWRFQGTVALLTTARPAPTLCQPRTGFPPPETLGADGAAIFFSNSPIQPDAKIRWNAHVGGQPANIPPHAYGAKYLVDQICPAAARREYRSITIKPKNAVMLNVGALICGPHFATGDAAVRDVLASMRFTKASG